MSGIDRLREHADDCDDCRSRPLAIDRIDAVLAASRVDVDSAALSRHAFAAARPVLHTAAIPHFWRRVAAVVAVTLVPLPAILAYDTVLLRGLHMVASTLLPGTMATYVVFTYASMWLLLFAASYASIPILMARNQPRLSTNG